MGHILRLTYGSTTIDLTDGVNYMLISYSPRMPEIGASEVIEPAKVAVMGASQQDVQDNKTALDRAFQAARDRAETGAGDKVYIEWQPDSTSDLWRSELYSGKAQPGDQAYEAQWAIQDVEVAIAWVRAPWWEGPEATLTLTNSSGSGTTRTVYNHDDSGTNEDNYVQLSTIDGDLPAPLIVSVTSLAATATQTIYLALGAMPDVANLPHVIEGESSSSGTQQPGAANTTNYSNGFYRTNSWAGDTESTAFDWTLSAALLNAARGTAFRVFAKFVTTAPDGIKARLQLLSGSFVLAKMARQHTLDDHFLQELGTLRLPPYQLDGSAAYPLTLRLTGQKTGGGSYDLDALYLMPTDGFKTYTPLGAGIEQNATLIDDQVAGKLYTTNHATAGQLGDYAGYGSLYALPGRTNRLYLLATTGLLAPISQTYTIAISYRPRRRG